MTIDTRMKRLAATAARPSPGKAIRLLFLADEEQTADSVRSALGTKRGEIPLKYTTVTPRALRSDLANVDVILACISEKKAAYLKLLRDVRASKGPIGFIVISPPEPDGLVASYVEAGADDYISVNEMSRLPVAVRNVYEKIKASRALIRIKETRESERNTLGEGKPGCLVLDVSDGSIVGMDNRFEEMYIEASPDMNVKAYFNPARVSTPKDHLFSRFPKSRSDAKRGSQVKLEFPGPNGSRLQVNAGMVMMEDPDGTKILLLVDDVAIAPAAGRGGKGTASQYPRKRSSTRTAINRANEFAFFTLGTEGRIRLWSESAARLTGHSKEEVLGKEFPVLFSESDRREGLPRAALETAGRSGHFAGEFEITTNEGKNLWVRVSVVLLLSESRERVGFAVACETLEENRRWQKVLVEREKELHGLAEHLEAAHENDRTKIARKLHDEFGQMLTALRLDVAVLNRMISKNVDSVKRIPLLEKLSVTSQLIESMISSTRRIITELRPAVLDELGLPTAILWQAQEFEDRTGISCRVGDLQHAVALNEKQATAVFRILQESLANASRHSKAANVTVSARVIDGSYVLTVIDDGIGIDLKSPMSRGSYGLLGIRERVASLGGEFDIESELGKGTVLTVRIPYSGD